MKSRIPFRPSIVLALLLVGMVVNALSLFFFLQIDHVVHSDLYRYGLNFNYEWAGQYWTYSWLIIGSLAISVIATGISALSVAYARTHRASLGFVCYLFLVVGIAASVLSALLFTRIDYIVHNDLYRYGLQFSYEWASEYWTYAGLLLGLIGLASATTAVSTALIFLGAQAIVTIDRTKLISYILISTGAAALTLSIVYTSSILAFMGLGLVFWGAIFTYIRGEEYSKRILLDATTLSTLSTLNQAIQKLDYKGKTTYLPPKYFADPETVRAYVPKHNNGELPTPEQTQKQEPQLISGNPDGILLEPPGTQLLKLLEKALGTSFVRIDLKYLEQKLPKTFIEDLEISRNLQIESENNKIRVTIEDSIYYNLHRETRKLPGIYNTLGCPLSSALACALAKATGKPITIENQQIDEETKSIIIEYRVLEEGQAEQ